MSLSDLASIATFVSGVAVLVSLVYLSQQIRQNTKHSRALIQQGRAARIADSAFRLAELRANDEMEKCFQGDANVSGKDVGRFLNIARAIFISAEDSYFQHREGLLDGMAFASFEASVRSGMGSAGIAAGWMLTREMYEPEFRAYIDRMLGDLNVVRDGTNRSLENWKAALASMSPKPAGEIAK
jgi:hypothetical protein